jgi:hypothetical protein
MPAFANTLPLAAINRIKLDEEGQYKISVSCIEDVDWKLNQRVYMDLGGFFATTILRIEVFENSELLSTAVIGAVGGGTGVHETSHIIEKERILSCCSDSIYCLSLPSLDLLWRTKADQATCFGVHAFHSDYIVHGELEISRLDKDGLVLWQRGGADIFTTLEGGLFELTEHYIIVEDWDNRIYKFDYSGNEVTN